MKQSVTDRVKVLGMNRIPLLTDDSPRRPLLLVSVRSAEEAIAARTGGADIIDVKEPARGSLGQADPQVIEMIAEHPEIRGKVPVTAALGEWAESAKSLAGDVNRIELLALLKVGVAGLAERRDAREHFGAMAASLESRVGRPILIPAAYADAERNLAPSVEEVLHWAVAARSPFFLIDTGIKDGRRLGDWLSPDRYTSVRRECRSAGIGLAIAGSLDSADVERYLADSPDVIAVRGAACAEGNRNGAICAKRVAKLVELLSASTLLPR